MDEGKVWKAFFAALKELQIEETETPAEPDDLDALIIHLAAFRSACNIARYLEAEGSSALLPGNSVMVILPDIAERMGSAKQEILEWAASIEIITMRELFDEHGQSWPEGLR